MDKRTHQGRSQSARVPFGLESANALGRLGSVPLPGFVGSEEAADAAVKKKVRLVDAQPKVEDDDAAESRMENEGGPPSAPTPVRRATRQ